MFGYGLSPNTPTCASRRWPCPVQRCRGANNPLCCRGPRVVRVLTRVALVPHGWKFRFLFIAQRYTRHIVYSTLGLEDCSMKKLLSRLFVAAGVASAGTATAADLSKAPPPLFGWSGC